VLRHHPDEDRARYLVLDLEVRDAPGGDSGAIGEAVVLPPLQIPAQAELVAGAEVDREGHVPVPGAGPLVEVFVPAGEDAGKGVDPGVLRSLDAPTQIEVGQAVGPGKRGRVHYSPREMAL